GGVAARREGGETAELLELTRGRGVDLAARWDADFGVERGVVSLRPRGRGKEAVVRAADGGEGEPGRDLRDLLGARCNDLPRDRAHRVSEAPAAASARSARRACEGEGKRESKGRTERGVCRGGSGGALPHRGRVGARASDAPEGVRVSRQGERSRAAADRKS